MKITSLALAALLVAPLCVAQQPDWEKRLADRHAQLVAKNGPGTDAALRDQLLTMRKEDQDARFRNINGANKAADVAALGQLDASLTSQLKTIVAAHGWPTIQLVGSDASDGAMLILIHSPDHAWQRAMISQLTPLAQQDKIDGSSLALLTDKELVAEHKLQRYGTQFKFVDGQAMMFAVEDPAHLDQRREQALLPPMSVYRKQLGDMYHVPVSDMIVRAE